MGTKQFDSHSINTILKYPYHPKYLTAPPSSFLIFTCIALNTLKQVWTFSSDFIIEATFPHQQWNLEQIKLPRAFNQSYIYMLPLQIGVLLQPNYVLWCKTVSHLQEQIVGLFCCIVGVFFKAVNMIAYSLLVEVIKN